MCANLVSRFLCSTTYHAFHHICVQSSIRKVVVEALVNIPLSVNTIHHCLGMSNEVLVKYTVEALVPRCSAITVYSMKRENGEHIATSKQHHETNIKVLKCEVKYWKFIYCWSILSKVVMFARLCEG